MTKALGILPIDGLIALSVSALEDELDANTYAVDELHEAIEAERAGQNRKTAIEALERQLPEPEPEPEPEGYKVAKGKSLTTFAGIKDEGDEITPDMVAGGTKQLEYLKSKGYLA